VKNSNLDVHFSGYSECFPSKQVAGSLEEFASGVLGGSPEGFVPSGLVGGCPEEFASGLVGGSPKEVFPSGFFDGSPERFLPSGLLDSLRCLSSSAIFSIWAAHE